MTSRDFCYWLQGFFEIRAEELIGDKCMLTNDQVDVIKKHLAMVFVHEIDPSFGGPVKQAALDAVHSKNPDERYRC